MKKLTREETVTRLRATHEMFTRDSEYRDPPNTGKPHESLDMFVEFDLIDCALYYLSELVQIRRDLTCPCGRSVAWERKCWLCKGKR